jgi:hypothetical protein
VNGGGGGDDGGGGEPRKGGLVATFRKIRTKHAIVGLHASGVVVVGDNTKMV